MRSPTYPDDDSRDCVQRPYRLTHRMAFDLKEIVASRRNNFVRAALRSNKAVTKPVPASA